MRSALFTLVLALAASCAQLSAPASVLAQAPSRAESGPAGPARSDSLASVDRQARAAAAMYALAVGGVAGGALVAALGCLVGCGAGSAYLSRDPHGGMAGVIFGLVIMALGALGAFPLALGLDLDARARRRALGGREETSLALRVALAPGPGELGLGAAIAF